MILHLMKRCGLLYFMLLASSCLCAADATPQTHSLQRTFSMIKPNAVQDRQIGGIIEMIEKAGLRVVALKMQQLTKERAENFYAEHFDRPFFAGLVTTMSSGPIVAMCIEGDNAVLKLREVVGATDPERATPGTIRAIFGRSVQENSIHASDKESSASREISFFFAEEEIFG